MSTPHAFRELWRPYTDAMEWDAANAPFAPDTMHDLHPWANIAVQRTRVAHAGARPAARCARAGVPLRPASASSASSSTAVGVHTISVTTSPPRLRRMQWLHVPKAGTSFGTTLVHYGCPRIPRDAAADEGAPIVALTTRFPRGKRRWCDANAFVGNLNGHAPLRYPRDRERGGHVVALFRDPASRLASECAAIDVEFRRAFADRAAAPPERRPRRRMAAAAAASTATATSSTGDDDNGGGADADAWEWAPGSVYADPFLRTFLLSHGFSHAAIAKLTRAWNNHKNAGRVEKGGPRRRIAPEACAALPGWRGCQTKMLLGLPCAAPLAGDDDGEGHAKAPSAIATGGGGGGAVIFAGRGAMRAAKVPVPVAPLTLNASHVAEAVRRVQHGLAPTLTLTLTLALALTLIRCVACNTTSPSSASPNASTRASASSTRASAAAPSPRSFSTCGRRWSTPRRAPPPPPLRRRRHVLLLLLLLLLLLAVVMRRPTVGRWQRRLGSTTRGTRRCTRRRARASSETCRRRPRSGDEVDRKRHLDLCAFGYMARAPPRASSTGFP